MHSADVERGFLVPCSQAMACELRVSRTLDQATPWAEATKTLTHSGLASAFAHSGVPRGEQLLLVVKVGAGIDHHKNSLGMKPITSAISFTLLRVGVWRSRSTALM